MALTHLQISNRYDAALLKTLIPILGPDPWGVGPGEDVGTQTIMFDDARNDEVVMAVNSYDAAVLDRQKGLRVEMIAGLRKVAIADEFAFMGAPLKLDVDTENALSKAYSALSRQPEGTTIDWEITRGQFVSFDLATIGAISDAAFVHVQKCFTNAKRLTNLVNGAADLDALDNVDLNSGWTAPVEA